MSSKYRDKCISGIAIFYGKVKAYQFHIGLVLLILVAYGYFERNFFSHTFPPFNEFLYNAHVFLWALALIGIILLIINLLSIKPFRTPIDSLLILFPMCFWIYYVLAYFMGLLVVYTLLGGLIFTGTFLGLLLLRWAITVFQKWHFQSLISRSCSNGINILKSDHPIRSYKDDTLSRTDFSQAIGQAIVNYQGKESFVLGITGKWGSGKSSVIFMALEYIEEIYKGKPLKPCKVEFNPWYFSNQQQLIEQFFNALSNALTSASSSENGLYIKDKLAKYSLLFENLSTSLLPQMLDFSNLICYLGEIALNKNEISDLKILKEQLNNAIRELSRPIIIVIDDIDRLTNNEMRQIFQLVKAIADFPNTIYLLSFDRELVSQSLFSEEGDSQKCGEQYLEKIIQLYLDIPLVPIQKVYKRLGEDLYSLFDKDITNDVRFSNMWVEGLKDFFSNIRDVNRFMNSFRFKYGLVKDNINVIDFMTVVALELFDYDSYIYIKNNKLLFTGLFSDGSTSEEKDRVKKIIDNVVGSSKYNILPILLRLFPKLESIYEQPPRGYNFSYLDICLTEHRICHPLNFELYFRFILNTNEMLPSEIESILSSIQHEHLFSENIDALIKDNKFLYFLDVFQKYITVEEKVPIDAIGNIMVVLLKKGDHLPSTSDFLLTTEQIIFSSIYRLCHRFKTQAEREAVLLGVANNVLIANAAEDSLYTYLFVVYLFDQEHGRYGLKENPSPEQDRTISSRALDELERIGLNKIKLWDTKRLQQHKQLRMILHIWNTWAIQWEKDNGEVKEFIGSQIHDNDSLIHFIGLFIVIGRRQTNESGVVYQEIKYFDLKGFKELVGEAFVSMRQRTENLDAAHLIDDQREILILFRDALAGKSFKDKYFGSD